MTDKCPMTEDIKSAMKTAIRRFAKEDEKWAAQFGEEPIQTRLKKLPNGFEFNSRTRSISPDAAQYNRRRLVLNKKDCMIETTTDGQLSNDWDVQEFIRIFGKK